MTKRDWTADDVAASLRGAVQGLKQAINTIEESPSDVFAVDLPELMTAYKLAAAAMRKAERYSTADANA